MSAAQPPSSDGHDWAAEQLSSNSARSGIGRDAAGRLVVLGYILAIALPVFGLIVGIVIAARHGPTSRHGRWIIALSVVAGVVWALVLISGVFTSPGNEQSY